MKRNLVSVAFACLFLALALWAHDPRTTAKEVGVSLAIEGSGHLTIKYKTMHFNQPVYERMKGNEQFRERMNSQLWNNIGTAEVGFDVLVGNDTLPKGTYQFGLNIEPGDQFSLTFTSGDVKKKIPLKVETGADVPYLTLALSPTDASDTFTLEGRCGTFRGTAPLKLPDLHPEHKH